MSYSRVLNPDLTVLTCDGQQRHGRQGRWIFVVELILSVDSRNRLVFDDAGKQELTRGEILARQMLGQGCIFGTSVKEGDNESTPNEHRVALKVHDSSSLILRSGHCISLTQALTVSERAALAHFVKRQR